MDISIALGGGGAKGNAHIGVIRRLEQEGFRIRAVAGTSFGGIVGVLYALGYSPDRIESIFSDFDQTKLYGRDADEGPSLLGLAGGRRWFQEILENRTFADLKIPCVVTAADLPSGREVLISEGSLLDAILATVAIPGIFPAKRIGDWELVDGGTLDPVPVAPARMLAPNLPVVAVILNAPMGMPAQTWNLPAPQYLPHSVMRRLSKTQYAQAFDVFLRSLDIMSRAVAHYRLELDKPEIVVYPDVAEIDTLQPVDVLDVVKRGEVALDAALPELKSYFAWYNRARRAIGV